ncbi:MAG TPA: hypothetical protein VL651_06650 [Bacteroidia bacterium]|jgi:hypothetical protein|nr:hypothetical protein [Bacteroidia bacterium]
MTTAKLPINFLHAENTDWLKRMDFYKHETQVLEERLKDATGLFESKEMKAKLEHFQNQLIIQKEKIDELSHDIRDHESYIENRVIENPTETEHRELNDHPVLRDRFVTFEKLYNDLRKEFYLFISKELR